MAPETEARKILLDIVEFLTRENVVQSDDEVFARNDLWNILTGLRGPDSNEFTEKECTTEPIRYALFKGKLPYAHNEDKMFSLFEDPPIDEHFSHHAEAAKQSLENLGFEVRTESR